MNLRLSLFSLAIAGICLSSCGNFDLDQDRVKEELTTYGASHPKKHVRIKTRLGTITAELYEDTPLHRANLLRLIEKGYYTDKAEFYRVIQSFMAQGGDQSRREPNYLVPNEIKHPHLRGALAAARRDANPGMASNPADFYIVTGEGWSGPELRAIGIKPPDPRFAQYQKEGGYPALDGKYTVFGYVTEGMDVVEKITELRTHEEKPVDPVTFTIEAF